MEKCSLTLLQALERLPELSERSLVKVTKEMLLGVAGVHELRVVHRDVKPDNFLCSGPDLTVKLCDFGLAEVLPKSSEEICGVNGTAPFMSPEMLSGGRYGKLTDVWSLGVIMYVLFIGQFPYIPAESNGKAMKAAIAAGKPAPRYRPAANLQLSEEVLALLKLLLCRDPAGRPSALEALDHDWFGMPTRDPAWKPPSLRAVLSAAKRIGAFDVRNGAGSERMDALDRELQELQERYQASGREESRHQNSRQPDRAAGQASNTQFTESVTSTTTGQGTVHCSGSDLG